MMRALTRSSCSQRRINSTETLARRADLIGRFVSVFFAPGSIGLVREGPEKRRRFVDQGLVSIDPEYLDRLQAYNRSLRQKASLLRELRQGNVGGSQARQEIVAWNREMASQAAAVCLGRADYASLISPFIAKSYNEIARESFPLDFVYKPCLRGVTQRPTQADFEKEILAELSYIMEDEIRRGRPLSGPHMDDFEVRLAGLNLRAFGSQGETRTAAISLILAQSDALFQRKQVRPVLFFDDIFSELDRERSRQLQEKSICEHQVFIATARREDVNDWRPEDSKAWEISRGRVESVAW